MAQARLAPGVVVGDITPHRVLFICWGLAVGLRFYMDARTGKGEWPCPGRFWRISGLYVLLALFAEVRPDLAAMLGAGFLVAFIGKQASAEIPSKGTFFGVKVR